MVDCRAHVQLVEKAQPLTVDRLPHVSKQERQEIEPLVLPRCESFHPAWEAAYTTRVLRDAELNTDSDIASFVKKIQPIAGVKHLCQ